MRCFFIGHADAEPSLRRQIDEEVRRHILEYGVTEFVVGQYGAFDMMAAAAVIKAKAEDVNTENAFAGRKARAGCAASASS